ncbi:autotransporter assembly complex family protein [Xinfangfangia sp. CPCC 101601]|uniref:Autotransporter assembly complex family protein n=1 Tax=Pseudogemmobacter lacusdianii TaxID=3069608 RepID=A0ABU0VTS8_9RHOB|nr:autotransporter assembly complex family protein [Xinfangfangia sp. CPCC 101601]MDQ2065137.1 autotransporter assembly complex family protein [Xinfangfangia sp. CPCC 101601]
MAVSVGKRTATALATATLLLAMALPQISPALDRLDFQVTGLAEDDALTKSLRAASLLLSQQADGATEPSDLFAASRADYARILGALYAQGHYAATISIRIDGREAANIPALNAPASVGQITVTVDPGPQFKFARTEIGPLAPRTELPSGFTPGEPAESTLVTQSVDAATAAWREAGHAKVAVSGQNVVADHNQNTLSAQVQMDPGPALRFGTVTVEGEERMRTQRILKIAGLRYGEKFSQSELDRAAQRLKRSGVFRSVTLTEAERPVGDLLPIGIKVIEEKTRRYSVGAELSSIDGISLSGYWLHRNLAGGGERLKVDLAVTNIATKESGMDYALGITLERPATITPDTTAALTFGLAHLDEVDYAANVAEFGLSFTQHISEQLTAKAGISYEYAEGTDPTGDFRYRSLSLPLGVTWDRRDKATDARKGFYIDAEAKPFSGFGTTGSGVRLKLDTRAYRSFGEKDRVTLAGRLQLGAIYGPNLLDTPRDDLFFSGGGGTVRGQPYRSLGVLVNRGLGSEFTIGGNHMAIVSAEVRTRVTDSIGVVGFVDAGQIGVDGFSGDASSWHAGAGLGLRYETGFGPIRLDVATPIEGTTGDGVQIYIGLGQSF